MRFLIIILSLLSERYMIHHMQKVRRTWLEYYIDFARRITPPSILNASPMGLYLVVLFSLLGICAVLALGKQVSLFFILYFVFEFAVFYLCLGEHNLFFMNTNISKNNYLNNKDYIIAINQEIIAIIIWFFAFGPAGALLYRVTLEFSKMQHFENHIQFFKDLLDWIPVRITALLILMVGHFQPGFSALIHQLFTSSSQNQSLLVSIAEHSLSTTSIEKVDISKLENLFAHACLLLLFFLAILMIGKFV
jgi:AmpE protein